MRLPSFISLLSIAWSSANCVLTSNATSLPRADSDYNITFLHVNDIHSHLDQIRPSGTDCQNVDPRTCVGGYARIKTKIDELRESTQNSLLINAGDEFQGTLFFSYYGGEKIAETLNQLGFDALTLGNHEFDRGDSVLAAYLKNLTFPIVCANIRTQSDLATVGIKPYHIFPQHGLAIIGLTTPDIPGISSPDASTFFDDPVQTLNTQVSNLWFSHPDIKRIVAITHIGYHSDITLAKQSRGVHLIIGGHSHTLVGSMPGAAGPYPTVVKNRDGEDVYIVTAYRYGEYLGALSVLFGPRGTIKSFNGEPIHLTSDIAQDAALQQQIEAWREPFDELGREVVGSTNGLLSDDCKHGECSLGNLISDAIMDYRKAMGGNIHGVMYNSGGVRASIDQGNITRSQVVTAFPFGNTVVDLNFTGYELWGVFEGIVSGRNPAGQSIASFVQVSKEISLTYDPTKPVGRRLVSLSLLSKDTPPSMEPIDVNAVYTIATSDFTAGGGDFWWPPRSGFVPLDQIDEVMIRFLRAQSPITPYIDGRIKTISSTGRQASFGDVLLITFSGACFALTLLVCGLEMRDRHNIRAIQL